MAFVVFNLLAAAALIGIDQAIKLWATNVLQPVGAMPQLHHMGDQRHCAHRLQSADSPELDGLIEADQRRNAQQIEDHKCHKNTPNGGMLPPVF